MPKMAISPAKSVTGDLGLIKILKIKQSLCPFIRIEVDTETKINPRPPKEVPDRRPAYLARHVSIRKRISCIEH